MRKMWIVLLALVLAACGPAQPGTGGTSGSAASSAGASAAPSSSAGASAAPSSSAAVDEALEEETITSENYPSTLTIMSHDSFNLSTDVVAEFERTNNVKLRFLKAGDAGSALNRALLTKNSPLADVLYGVDNTFFSRAVEGNIFEAYAPQGLEQIGADLRLDPENRLIPIDYGFVNLNYDKSSPLFQNTNPQALTLQDLIKPEFRGQVVVQNPATSSPGLAFMLATIAHFGEDGWIEWWQQMRDNGVVVVDSWDTAYYTNFSGSSGEGPQPIVVSYATSPAAEVAFSDGSLTEPPTGNILPTNGVFRQIEFAGILRGTQNLDLAKKWMDYMLSERVQNDIMPQMVVYPALPSATIPDVYQQFAPVPTAEQIARLDPQTIAQNRERWLREWTQAVVR